MLEIDPERTTSSANGGNRGCFRAEMDPDRRGRGSRWRTWEEPMKKLLLLAAAVSVGLASGSALADTSDKRIALSNNYAGNSWRQAMLTSWEKVTGQAVEDGVVAAADAFTTAENQVTEQAAQIQNLILQGYDAIVLNAASPEGLNGAVKEACDAGVIVVSFDGIVTEPCAWRIAVDFKQMGKDEVLYLFREAPRRRQPARDPGPRGGLRRRRDQRGHP
jgi:ABC-type sugar transport system substrate-binding protein